MGDPASPINPMAPEEPRDQARGQQGEDEARSVAKAIERLPEVREFMAMSMGPMANPLHQKMTPEHITSVIELAHRHDEREFQLAEGQQRIQSSDRWFLLATMVVAVVTVLTIIVLFRDNREVLVPVLTAIVAFLGGFGSGLGYKRARSE